MKMARILAGVMLLLTFFPWTVPAQSPHQGRALCVPPEGLSLDKLGLSREQRTAVDGIEKAYSDRIHGLQGRLLSKRLEFQAAFRNPQADEETVRARAREVIDLQGECRDATLDLQIAIRGVLTAQQLQSLCAPRDWCFPGSQGN